MKKVLALGLSLGVMTSSLFISGEVSAAKNNAVATGIGEAANSVVVKNDASMNLKARLTDSSGELANAKVSVEPIVNLDAGYGNKVALGKVTIEEVPEQIPVEDGPVYAPATDASTTSKWVGNVTGYVTINYHVDTKSGGYADSTDMNSVRTSWSKSSGAFVSNRKLLIRQIGKSHFGDHYDNVSVTKYPSSDSATTFDVPDAWLPLWEGLQEARTTSTVVSSGLSYSLTVNNQILSP